jgi:hypothetical protein
MYGFGVAGVALVTGIIGRASLVLSVSPVKHKPCETPRAFPSAGGEPGWTASPCFKQPKCVTCGSHIAGFTDEY